MFVGVLSSLGMFRATRPTPDGEASSVIEHSPENDQQSRLLCTLWYMKYFKTIAGFGFALEMIPTCWRQKVITFTFTDGPYLCLSKALSL